MSFPTAFTAAAAQGIESKYEWNQGCTVAADIAPPPGLLPPPGLAPPAKLTKAELDAALQRPPGFFQDVKLAPKMVEEAPSAVEVTIRGMPHKLLSQMMVEAMLEQVPVDSPIVSFSIRHGLSYGCIDAKFASTSDAHACVKHFNGRTWDSAGVAVRAEITSALPVKTLLGTTPTPQRSNKQVAPKLVQPMSAHAPAFQSKSQLCAASPAFVPVGDLQSKAHLATSKSAVSETSTDLGESESDNDSRSSVKL